MLRFGTVFILNMAGCQIDFFNDYLMIKRIIEKAAKIAKIKITGFVHKKFYPQGLTVVATIKESHIAVDTWPEERSIKITFDTCGDGGKAKDAVLFLVKTFRPKNYSVLEIECANTEPYFRAKEYIFEI
jgi:S-adenosylmethionine decarboxylase proenzyme